MTYAVATGTMVLFGGGDVHGRGLGDTWVLDPAARRWSVREPGGSTPAARESHAAAYHPGTGRLIVFGGKDEVSGTYFNDTWGYDPSSNAWCELTPPRRTMRMRFWAPSARSGHAMAYVPGVDKVILYGGGDRRRVGGDTWAYDPATNAWTCLEPRGDLPSPRHGHTMTYCPGPGTVLLFGGLDKDGDALNDTWAYDPVGNAWALCGRGGDVPPVRAFAAMTLDAGNGRVILFGGMVGASVSNDTWSYDPAKDRWTRLLPSGAPAARDGHSLAYDPGTERTVLFGGWDGDGAVDDTWLYRR